MRFELIDRVVEQEADRLVAVKAVTLAEEYLADHFPGFAVLPGVMMLEVLVQAGRRLTGDDAGVVWVVDDVRNVRYGQMVRPGESLEVEVSVKEREPRRITFRGVGKVKDQVAVQGRFSLCAMDRPETA